jgi:hypothetical protein
MAAGVMAAAGTTFTTSAEAHWRGRGGCCTYYKKVRYYKPVSKLVKRVEHVRVRGYRTVHVKKLYRDRCGCRKFYRTVAYRKPYVTTVAKVKYYRVRSHQAYTVKKLYRRRCCC